MLYLPGEDGQGLAEYGLVLVLIAVVIVVVLALIGTQISELYQSIVSGFPS